MWDILLATSEDCVEVASHKLITKDLILWTEYEGWHRTRVAVYKVPH